MLEPLKSRDYDAEKSLEISTALAEVFKYRRTTRNFSNQPVDEKVIENAIRVAGLAPSGANKQPWRFCVIKNEELKQKIRTLAEQKEHQFYNDETSNKNWIEDLKHLHTNEDKSFLTEAPYIIAVFLKHYDLNEQGEREINYYAKESTGIATGMLISALHMSGLNILTYTPSRMQFLTSVLGRPKEERSFMVLGVGLPHESAQVPQITKKSLDQILSFYK